MKINHIIMNLDAGGAQTFVASLAMEQKELGHDVSIIIIDELINSDFQKLLVQGLREKSVDLYFLNRRPGRNITIVNTIKGIIKTLSAVNPDIINTHISTSHLIVSICLRFALKRLKNRHVITVHNAPEEWSRMTHRFNEHTPSIYCSYSALDLNPKRDCLSVAIQNGIPKLKIDDRALPILRQFNNNGVAHRFVLCVGRLSKQKNYDMVCEVAQHFEGKNVHFLVCGIKQETAEQDLENFSKISNIHFIGTKTQEEVYSLMSNCDCFFNASLWEGLPITVLEAFFAGIPCVLSDIPPHIEIGTNMPNCYISSLESKESFISNIEKALDHTENKQQILQARQSFLRTYTISTTANNYVDFYNKVLENV
ncbi:glycosyltransferase family 4 protein [Mucilaginibacter sp. BT774]|uniref:glycosyltransferase family 4 protein n=1 Tax=Mucilaginibacter sp. BT774 TaxID=3062276 RepID=UPI002674F623|nr:glycosyltransferase family 4 protein [Mucilaginibacter sp. BT774]